VCRGCHVQLLGAMRVSGEIAILLVNRQVVGKAGLIKTCLGSSWEGLIIVDKQHNMRPGTHASSSLCYTCKIVLLVCPERLRKNLMFGYKIWLSNVHCTLFFYTLLFKQFFRYLGQTLTACTMLVNIILLYKIHLFSTRLRA
jgi:hypothetical protein